MAVLRLDRFTIDPADTGELLTRHAALVAAIKDAFPGLIGVELAWPAPLSPLFPPLTRGSARVLAVWRGGERT